MELSGVQWCPVEPSGAKCVTVTCVYPDVTMKEVGLEGALFTLLDRQSDCCLRKDIQESLIHMMSSSTTAGKLGLWLKLCKDVLSATSGASNQVLMSCGDHILFSFVKENLSKMK